MPRDRLRGTLWAKFRVRLPVQPKNLSSVWWSKRDRASISVRGGMDKNQSKWRSYKVRKAWIIVFMFIEVLAFIPALGIFGLLPNRRFGRDFWLLIGLM